jgi:hypothetical protein|tara:strand:+ start:1716 stop:1985 length:270 start_codon:yes stop_codon:yes gene_type:complete
MEKELSEEELAAKRNEITAFYKENIKHLKVQLEYEEMLKDIEKARAERVQAQMFLAQSMAPAPENSNEDPMPERGTPAKRSLKKVSDEV